MPNLISLFYLRSVQIKMYVILAGKQIMGYFFIILNHISEGSKVFFLESSSILNIETEFVESAKNMSTEIEIAEKST